MSLDNLRTIISRKEKELSSLEDRVKELQEKLRHFKPSRIPPPIVREYTTEELSKIINEIINIILKPRIVEAVRILKRLKSLCEDQRQIPEKPYYSDLLEVLRKSAEVLYDVPKVMVKKALSKIILNKVFECEHIDTTKCREQLEQINESIDNLKKELNDILEYDIGKFQVLEDIKSNIISEIVSEIHSGTIDVLSIKKRKEALEDMKLVLDDFYKTRYKSEPVKAFVKQLIDNQVIEKEIRRELNEGRSVIELYENLRRNLRTLKEKLKQIDKEIPLDPEYYEKIKDSIRRFSNIPIETDNLRDIIDNVAYILPYVDKLKDEILQHIEKTRKRIERFLRIVKVDETLIARYKQICSQINDLDKEDVDTIIKIHNELKDIVGHILSKIKEKLPDAAIKILESEEPDKLVEELGEEFWKALRRLREEGIIKIRIELR